MDLRLKCDEENVAAIFCFVIKNRQKSWTPGPPCYPDSPNSFSIYPTWTITQHRWAVCCFTLTRTAAERHETMASCHCQGLKPRPSLSLVSYALNPLYPSLPLVPQGLPSPRWRDFYHAFGEGNSFFAQISVTQRDQLPFCRLSHTYSICVRRCDTTWQG